jgi:hypothetical protein
MSDNDDELASALYWRLGTPQAGSTFLEHVEPPYFEHQYDVMTNSGGGEKEPVITLPPVHLSDGGLALHLEKNVGMQEAMVHAEKCMKAAALQCIESPPRKDATSLHDFTYLLPQPDDPRVVTVETGIFASAGKKTCTDTAHLVKFWAYMPSIFPNADWLDNVGEEALSLAHSALQKLGKDMSKAYAWYLEGVLTRYFVQVWGTTTRAANSAATSSEWKGVKAMLQAAPPVDQTDQKWVAVYVASYGLQYRNANSGLCPSYFVKRYLRRFHRVSIDAGSNLSNIITQCSRNVMAWFNRSLTAHNPSRLRMLRNVNEERVVLTYKNHGVGIFHICTLKRKQVKQKYVAVVEESIDPMDDITMDLDEEKKAKVERMWKRMEDEFGGDNQRMYDLIANRIVDRRTVGLSIAGGVSSVSSLTEEQRQVIVVEQERLEMQEQRQKEEAREEETKRLEAEEKKEEQRQQVVIAEQRQKEERQKEEAEEEETKRLEAEEKKEEANRGRGSGSTLSFGWVALKKSKNRLCGSCGAAVGAGAFEIADSKNGHAMCSLCFKEAKNCRQCMHKGQMSTYQRYEVVPTFASETPTKTCSMCGKGVRIGVGQPMHYCTCCNLHRVCDDCNIQLVLPPGGRSRKKNSKYA